MFSLLLNKFGAWIAAIGGVLLALLAALGMAKRAGRKEEQQAQEDKALQQGKESSEIDDKVRSASSDDLAARLRRDQRD